MSQVQDFLGLDVLALTQPARSSAVYEAMMATRMESATKLESYCPFIGASAGGSYRINEEGSPTPQLTRGLDLARRYFDAPPLRHQFFMQVQAAEGVSGSVAVRVV
jgi:hypothetical protein